MTRECQLKTQDFRVDAGRPPGGAGAWGLVSRNFCLRHAFQVRIRADGGDVTMKQIFPVFLALIPLAAVVGACVTCP